MKHAELWQPSKFDFRGGDWRASLNSRELSPVSRVSATLALNAYKVAITTYAKGHLADLGCGKVPLYGLYKDLTTQTTCIDWPSSLHESPHIDVFADLNQPIGVPDNAFDTILSSSVLEHIWRHDVFWDEIVRILRPGGHVILDAPFVYMLHEEPHDYFRWTRHALEAACNERGLEIVSLEPYGDGLDVIADLLVRSIGAISRPLAGAVGRAVAWVLARRSKRRSDPLPLGYMLVARSGTA